MSTNRPKRKVSQVEDQNKKVLFKKVAILSLIITGLLTLGLVTLWYSVSDILLLSKEFSDRKELIEFNSSEMHGIGVSACALFFAGGFLTALVKPGKGLEYFGYFTAAALASIVLSIVAQMPLFGWTAIVGAHLSKAGYVQCPYVREDHRIGAKYRHTTHRYVLDKSLCRKK